MPRWGADPGCGTGLQTLPTTYENVQLAAVVSSHDVRRQLQVPDLDRSRVVGPENALAALSPFRFICEPRLGFSWPSRAGALVRRAAHTYDSVALQGPVPGPSNPVMSL